MVAGKAPIRRPSRKVYSLALRQRAHRSRVVQDRTGEPSGIDVLLESLESEMEGQDRLHGPARRRRARGGQAALLSSGAWAAILSAAVDRNGSGFEQGPAAGCPTARK